MKAIFYIHGGDKFTEFDLDSMAPDTCRADIQVWGRGIRSVSYCPVSELFHVFVEDMPARIDLATRQTGYDIHVLNDYEAKMRETPFKSVVDLKLETIWRREVTPVAKA